MNHYFTIGMAGHIDHGKTALTKALTGVQTDRLKEERERNISIEPGFAPFIQEDNLEVSIVDVPGHENFIRQMIAGVAGIDMVLMVVAADEGIMPQTKEHLDILTLLGMNNGWVVLTKSDQVEETLFDLVFDDIKENVAGTFLEKAPIYVVDSLTGKGIPALKTDLREELKHMPISKIDSSFRLPIDHVFTVKGQGVVVRGTVYNGEVRQGERLHVLPRHQEVRVRQIQSHHQQKMVASKGQRAAINVGGIAYGEVSRGDVLVSDDFYSVSDRMDIVFHPLRDLHHKIKQRQLIKLHIGTAEVMGRIIFFDRNFCSVGETGEILCQLQLDGEVVVTRGDRFIVRRPTPAETLGGGWVIEPNAQKYRFGKETIEQLSLKKEGSAKDRVFALMKENIVLTDVEIIKQAAISKNEYHDIQESLLEIDNGLYTLPSIFEQVLNQVIHRLEVFHKRFPMRIGIDKAELLSEWKQYPAIFMEFALEVLKQKKSMKSMGQYLSLYDKIPSLPVKWKKRLEQAEKELIRQGQEVEKWVDIMKRQPLPIDIQHEFYYFLIQTKKAFVLDDDRLISRVAVNQAVKILREQTCLNEFTLQTAREALQLTRKNLVPLLELLDTLGYTRRVGNIRTWERKHSKKEK